MRISVSSNQSGLQELVPARSVTQRNLVSKNKTDKKKNHNWLTQPRWAVDNWGLNGKHALSPQEWQAVWRWCRHTKSHQASYSQRSEAGPSVHENWTEDKTGTTN